MLDLHCERQAVLDLDGQDFSLAKLGNRFEHFGGLLLQPEVRKGGLAARAVLATDLDLSHDARRGFERGLTRHYTQAFNPAKIQILEQLNKATLRF